MIRFFDYLDEYRSTRGAIEKAIARVLNSGQLILGAEGATFEKKMATFLGAKYGVGVNSGTDALTIALRTFAFKPGSEVITVSNTTVPTIAAIRNANLTPVFADINLADFQIDPDRIESLITSRTVAVVLVHLYGIPAPAAKVVAICRKHGLRLIEDCAQSLGSRIRGRHTGTFGDISCFSFYPTKNLGAYGDGGLCVTSSRRLRDRMTMLRFYGFDKKRIARFEGTNSRLDELQAGILNIKLENLARNIEKRIEIARRFRTEISNPGIILPTEPPDCTIAYHLFVVRSTRRNRLQKHLEAHGIQTAIHYPVPVHLMPAYKFLGYRRKSLPETERAAAEILSIPLHPALKRREIDQVIAALNSFRPR